MSSGNLKEIYQETNEGLNENILELDVDYSKIVIPFSKMFKPYKPKDIYSGNERIPFSERDPEYKMIMRYEFANFIKEKNYK